MNFIDYLLLLASVSIIGGIFSAVKITIFLQNHGVNASMLWWSFKFIKYINQYKEITLTEQGKIGKLFHLHIISFNLALFSFIIVWIIT